MANEVQQMQIAVVSELESGTFTLTFDGQTTGNIAWNADAAAIQTSLEALSNIGAGNVAVTNVVENLFNIEFQGSLANTSVPEITGDGSALRQKADTIFIEGLGGAPIEPFQMGIQLSDAPVEGTFKIRDDTNAQETAAIAYNANAAAVEAAIEAALTTSGLTSVSASGDLESFMTIVADDEEVEAITVLAIEVTPLRKGIEGLFIGTSTEGSAANPGPAGSSFPMTFTW